MSRIRSLILGVPFAVLAATAGQAADMPGDFPLPLPAEQPRYPGFKALHGWYLRGDIGYRFGKAGNVTPEVLGVTLPDLTDNELKGAFVGGFGFGIKTQWLRTDVTLDYGTKQDYTSNTGLGAFGLPEPNAKVQSATILLNGYLDLGTWYGLTPYVGGGAGVAHVKVSDFLSNYWSLLPPLGLSQPASHSQWNFAWVVMGGVGWQIAPNLAVDLGYRYLNIGDATSDPDALVVAKLKNLASHEIRLGLRWYFDDFGGFH